MYVATGMQREEGHFIGARRRQNAVWRCADQSMHSSSHCNLRADPQKERWVPRSVSLSVLLLLLPPLLLASPCFAMRRRCVPGYVAYYISFFVLRHAFAGFSLLALCEQFVKRPCWNMKRRRERGEKKEARGKEMKKDNGEGGRGKRG